MFYILKAAWICEIRVDHVGKNNVYSTSVEIRLIKNSALDEYL